METATHTTTTSFYKNLGWTEDVCQCECCGKIDLKGTYTLEEVATGAIVHFGSQCAGKAQGWTKKEFETAYKKEVIEQERAAKVEYRTSAPFKAIESYMAYLDTTSPYNKVGPERWDMISDRNPKWIELQSALAEEKAIVIARYPLAKHIY